MNDKQQLHAIYLESHDEITAVIDQLRSCPDETIALVAGQRIGILQSMVNLKLIIKNSKALGKQILIITTDGVALSLANQLQVPTFSKLEHAQKYVRGEKYGEETLEEPFRESGDPKTSSLPSSPRSKSSSGDKRGTGKKQTIPDLHKLTSQNRPLLFAVALLGLLPVLIGAYAALTALPYARISIVPMTEEFTQNFEIRASESTRDINYLAKQIPAYFYETQSETSKTAAATKLVDIGTKATGNVTVFNRYSSEPISLAAGTAITSYDGKIFHTKNDVTIPALKYEAGVIYQGIRSQVAVEADEVGEEYNLEKTDFTISGYEDNSSLFWAESNEEFTGGEKHEALVVGQEDIDSLRTQILTELSTQNQEQLLAMAAQGQIFIDGSIQDRIIEETNSAELDQEAEEFTLFIKIESKGLFFQEADLDQIITRTMSLSIPPGYEPLTDQTWDCSYDVISMEADTRSIVFTGHGKGLIAKKISTADLKTRLQGLNYQQADIILSRYDETILEYDIEIGPFWVKSIPTDTEKITVNKLSAEDFAELKDN